MRTEFWLIRGVALCGAIAVFLIHPVHAGETPAPAGQPVLQLTLDEAVLLALRQNPDILKAEQDIERTRGLVIEVRGRALPQVVLTASYNQQDPRLLESGGGGSGFGASSQSGGMDGSADASASPTPAGTPGDSAPESQDQSSSGGSSFASFISQDKSWDVSVTARQVLYAGGRVGSALKIARFQEDNSYFQLLETVNTVIAAVRRSFYEVLLNRALIGVQEESVELLQRQLGDQQSRFEAGTVPRFNVLRAEVELANVQPDLIRARNTFLLSRLRLARLLGIASSSVADEVNPPVDAVGRLETTRRPVPLSDALTLAKVQRPFLKVQRKTILIEAQNITQALAGYKPEIHASAGYTVRNSRLSEDLQDTVDGWFFGVDGSWAIFDGFSTYGKTRQARARLESAKLNYDDSVLQVELEVQDALTRVQQARALVLSQTKTVEQATEALRLSGERFSAGAGTQLEVLDARVALTQARATEVQARYEYNVAMADFAKATGDATQYDAGFDDPMLKARRRK